MIDIADAGEIKAKISIEYNPEGVKQAKEDLASLAEMGGALESSAGQASDGFAALDEQMSKSADSTKALTSSMGALEKPLVSGETAISGMTETLSEQQSVIEDTTKSLSNMQEPLKSYNESLQGISETVNSGHFAENMSAFQDALENPYPFSMVNQYLKETGQSWDDFTTSIGTDNTAMLHEMATNSDVTHKVLNTMSSDVQSVGKTFTESADSAEAFTKQFNGLNESVVSTGKALNEFGGVGERIYGPMPAMMKEIGLGEAFSGATEGIMGALNDIAMPLMAVQMIAMAVGQVGQGIYNMAAIAEGPAAHSVGTFTGTIDALGQSAQNAASQFSEGFGRQVLPTLNALNSQASQGTDTWGQLGGVVGGVASTVANLWQIGTGFNTIGGIQGLANQAASALGLPQPYQGSGSVPQTQQFLNQQYAQMPQTVEMAAAQTQIQSSITLAEAINPQYLAAQNQLQASQAIAQRLQQSYNISHPLSQYQMIQDAKYQQYAQEQGALYQQQMAQGPDVLGNIGSVFSSIGSGISNWWKDVTAGDSTGLTAGGSEPLPFGCFPAGTRVLMSDGREQAIETLQVGAQVFAHDGADHGVVTTVLALIKPPPRQVYALTFDDGNTLTLTDSHPVATTEGWKALSVEHAKQENPDLAITALEIGDTVVTASGPCELIAIRPGAVVQIYNITVDEPHTFYANNVLVHNKTMSAGGVGTEQVQLAHTFTAEITWEANNLQKQFTGVANWVGQGLANTFQGIASWIGQGLANTFQGVANWIGSGLSNTFQGVANWIGQGLSNTFQGVANWIGEGLQNTFQGVANWIGQNLNNTFKGVADWVGQGLNNTFKGVADWVGQNLEHTFNAVASWTAQNLTPNFTVNPGFTLLAEGTSNWGGGPAVVGESGTEVVESNGQYSLFDQGATLLNLPAGANVYPMKNLASSSVPQFADGTGGSDFFPISFGGGNSSITLHIQMMMPDGRMMAEHIIPNIAPMIRQQFGRRA